MKHEVLLQLGQKSEKEKDRSLRVIEKKGKLQFPLPHSLQVNSCRSFSITDSLTCAGCSLPMWVTNRYKHWCADQNPPSLGWKWETFWRWSSSISVNTFSHYTQVTFRATPVKEKDKYLSPSTFVILLPAQHSAYLFSKIYIFLCKTLYFVTRVQVSKVSFKDPSWGIGPWP